MTELNGKEKIKVVLELHKQGKTYRKIAHDLHMSLRDIRSIIKKSIDDAKRAQVHRRPVEEHHQPKLPIYVSKRSHALKLFSEDKKPLDVAIQLDLSADEVRVLYQDYLKLNGFNELAQVYADLDYNLYTLLDLYKIMKQNSISHFEILEAVKHGNKLPYLNDEYQKLRNHSNTMQVTRDKLMNDLSMVRSEISDLTKTKTTVLEDIQNKRHDIISLKNKLVRLENLVNLKLDKEEYQNMEKFVEQTVWSFLYEKEELLVIAVGVVLESCLRDPIMGPHLASSSSQISFHNRILQSSKRLFDKAVRICVNRTMDELPCSPP